MEDLSLHILDVVENSTGANANLIEISIIVDIKSDTLTININDNGKGMDSNMLKNVRDPFTTTRTTRRVGLGVSLLEQAANEAGGILTIESEPDVGTKVSATFKYSHIDRKPVGDIGSTITTLIMGNPELDFVYYSNIDENEIELDTREIRPQIGEVPISHPSVIKLIRELFE